MEKIRTKDGSYTFKNEEYDETYHSFTGAIEETYEKFIKPIDGLFKRKKIRILDIGFGLGYNAVAAVDKSMENGCEIEIISLEKNLVLDSLKELEPPLKHYHILRKLELDPITGSYFYEDKDIHLQIKVGDAVKTIKTITKKFDACFLDAFSPKKNPEMWTESFISDIASLMSDGSVLLTYSCARVVRDSLRSAGFEVHDGPKVGRRGPSTIAIFKKSSP
ncbi:MAG: MnmC family methyltransferase [Candidatus Woesearchaeota archaeon]|nr:MnmC family methyltransferase [Candidatus Woesearchaeota archaeon]